MDTIYIKELMTTSVVSIAPDAQLADVIQSMISNRYSCIVAVDDKMPVGIITERDIVRLMAEALKDKLEPHVRVRDVMSVPVITLNRDSTLFEALVIASAQKIRHLPVIDEQGQLIGLVTQSDLVRAHFQVFEKQREIIDNLVISRTRELQEAHDQLKALTMVDALMGIGNRRAMEVDLDHTHALSLRYKRGYAVCLFDVDYFKLYNDSYGHLAGDDVLVALSGYLQSRIRKSDRLYRYGGEEILLLLPETPLEGAMILGERIIEGLQERGIPHSASPFSVVTMSCGVATQPSAPVHATWREVVALADEGLYNSKLSGRNRATCRMAGAALTRSEEWTLNT